MSFVIFSMPRCRTRWLSVFLSSGAWQCCHEELRHCRSLEDVRSWLSQPYTGTVETAAASFWRLLERFAPDASVVTLRRDPRAVAASLARAGLVFEDDVMARVLRHIERKLDQIERRLPNVMALRFEDLNDEAVIARLVFHCTGQAHDHDWWERASGLNIQASVPHMLLYAGAYAQQTERLRRLAKYEMLRALRRPIEIDGVTFQQELLWDAFTDRDGQRLMSDECVGLGEQPDAWRGMNLPLLDRLEQNGRLHIFTARSNGRMFGYLVTALGEAFHCLDQVEAEQVSFYADPGWPGLGRKLQHAAIEDLRRAGVNRVLMFQPDETRVGLVYRRLGARQTGQRYVLELQ